MKIVSAAEAEQRFGEKWGKWDKEMFERLTTDENLRRFINEKNEKRAFADLGGWLEDAKFAALDGSLESFRRYAIEKLRNSSTAYLYVYAYIPVWGQYNKIKRTGERGKALHGAYVGVWNDRNFWLGQARAAGYIFGKRLAFANGEIRTVGKENTIAAAAVVAIEKFIEGEYLKYAFGRSNGKEELTI